MPVPIRPLLLMSTALLAATTAGAQTTTRNVNLYGMPGAIDTPTAEAFPDATLGASLSYSDFGRRTNVTFQALPSLTAGLRYARIKGIDPVREALYDRSFDLQFQLLGESGWRPSVAVGLRDLLGTGVYSAEYVVATRNLTPRLQASAGVGWGRLAGAWRRTEYGDEGGTPNVDDWFTGSAKPFASVIWQASDTIRLAAEYSSDDYLPESEGGAEQPDSKLNLSATYDFGNYQLTGYTIGGKTFGIQASMQLGAKESPYPSGLEPAPAPVRPRPAPAADPEGWSGAWSADPTAQPAIQTALAEALRKEGQELQGMSLSATHAEVRIDNRRYVQQAQALGRTARLMTRALPPSVETFTITSVESGLPTSSVTFRRGDLERLENSASANIAQAGTLTDAVPSPGGMVATPGLYPKLRYGLRPYLATGLFDPDDPFRYEVGGEAYLRYELQPGLVLAGRVRQRVLGNMDQRAPGGMTVEEYAAQDEDVNALGVPRVRSDGRMYVGNDKPTIPSLTLSWNARPTQTTYSRVTVGLLERAYAGISAELLWKPVNSRLALGAEINRVRKRDFEDALKFRDYEVTTGHVSAYYDFGSGFWGQLDVGQYLAGDVGATVSVNREFANGWRVGGYVTKTDLSAEEFGEGSFDKGIRLSIPINWATGQPSQQTVGGTIRSLSRDGGSRVNVDGRLYETVRDSHAGKVYEGWGRFWR